MPHGDGRNGPAARAVGRAAFDHHLRTGVVLGEPARRALHETYERKFNPNHDPADGRFTSGPGGAKKPKAPKAPRLPGTEDPTKKAHYYQGETANGLGPIQPTSGGYVDANGRYVPDVFPPDPYAIRTPADALAHYIGGSGQPMNFYANGIDVSSLQAEDFPSIKQKIDAGQSGNFIIRDAQSQDGLDTSKLSGFSNFSAAKSVGGVAPAANGVLQVNGKGEYSFSGWTGFHEDPYDFDKRSGRTREADALTFIGSLLKGKPFTTYIVGTLPFLRAGSR